MIYKTLRFNIFYAVNYDYPFPINIAHIFVDNFLLIVHEAGHTFFGIFGFRFLEILGGSLFQILLPLLIVLYFWVNSGRVGMQFSLFLVGYSWLDVAAYAADAQARQLPLIGNLSDQHHDWFNLMYRMGSVESGWTVGMVFAVIGILCYLIALFYPLMHREYEEVSLNLEM